MMQIKILGSDEDKQAKSHAYQLKKAILEEELVSGKKKMFSLVVYI